MRDSTSLGEVVRGWSSSGDVFGSVLAGLLIGLGLDFWLGTAPIFVVIFVVVAAVGSFYKTLGASEIIEDQAAEAIRIRDGL